MFASPGQRDNGGTGGKGAWDASHRNAAIAIRAQAAGKQAATPIESSPCG